MLDKFKEVVVRSILKEGLRCIGIFEFGENN